MDDFKLRTHDDLWADRKDYITAIEASSAVTNVSALEVAQSGQHIGRSYLCHETKLNTRYVPDGFCWDENDDTTSNYDEKGGWTPQGLTGTHDSQPDETIDGNYLYAASWHWGSSGSKDEFARVSFVHNTGSRTSYGHVLLVKPEPGKTFSPVKNTHADGVVWYGHRLFVANGGELQVYDTRHLWRMNHISGDVGVEDGVSSARWHQWAMPMIARYWIGDRFVEDVRDCTPGIGDFLCLSSLSLDRSGPDHLVSGEFRDGVAGGRVIRWPLNADVALPKADNGEQIGTTTASAGYTTPVWNMQGVATDGEYYYMSGQCPNGWNGDLPPDHRDTYDCIHRARPNEAPHVFTMAPRMTQNLSYAPVSGRLWGLNEIIDTSGGDRVVFSIDVAP